MYPAQRKLEHSQRPELPAEGQGAEIPFSNSYDFTPINELLKDGVADGVFPGAVLLIGREGQVIYRGQVGNKWLEAPEGIRNEMSRDTVFDIASMTSVVATTTLVMRLVEGGKLQLTDRVSRFIQCYGVAGKSSTTIEHLLSHSAGLPHWIPFFEDLVKANATDRLGILTSRGARDYIFNALHRLPAKYEPGTRQVFSDLGFMLLGEIISMLTGLSLDKAAQRYVFAPLGMSSTSYIDLSKMRRRGIHPVRDRIAPTEDCPWRNRILCGEVHDDNAWAMGGLAGHAGVFSNAQDLHLFATAMLSAYRGNSTFLRRETVMRFFDAPRSYEADAGFCLGWESPNRENGMFDSKLSEKAVGVCGFTGGSLWLEPTLGIDIVLLTNRVHPTRSNKQIRTFRPKLHSLILEALGH